MRARNATRKWYALYNSWHGSIIRNTTLKCYALHNSRHGSVIKSGILQHALCTPSFGGGGSAYYLECHFLIVLPWNTHSARCMPLAVALGRHDKNDTCPRCPTEATKTLLHWSVMGTHDTVFLSRFWAAQQRCYKDGVRKCWIPLVHALRRATKGVLEGAGYTGPHSDLLQGVC